MRWPSERGMGHLWAPQDLPAAGARRYGHALTRRRTRKQTGRRTRLWRYISGKIVELMSQKCPKSSSSRYGDIITCRLLPMVRLGWLAPPDEACPAVDSHQKSFSVSRVPAAHVTALLSRGRAARSRRKSQLAGLFFVRVGCSVAWKFRMDTNGLGWNERP